LGIPLDTKIENVDQVPYTTSYVIRKRIQMDNLYEIPKNKRPTEKMIWDGSPEEMEEWMERVVLGNSQSEIEILDTDVE
jgi:hypothetical protein